MLTGESLGKALAEAIALKGVKKVDVAAAFGVKPPSVQDWVKFGRISKTHIPKLLEYFSDVVGPAHWGLSSASTIPAETSGRHDVLHARDPLIDRVVELMGTLSIEQKQRVVDFAEGVASQAGFEKKARRAGHKAA